MIKLKTKIYIIIAVLFMTFLKADAVDYYPETGIDPFYSNLNPEFINEDDTVINKNDTLFNLIKNKKQQKKVKKENQQEEIITNIIAEPAENETDIKSDNKFLSIFRNKDKNKELIEADEDVDEVLYKKNLEKELNKEEREKQKAIEKAAKKDEPSLKEKIKAAVPFLHKDKQKQENDEPVIDPNIELTADYMEYFPDRYEVEAKGNAKVTFKNIDTSISANKIIFDYDKNILRAIENVILISNGTITEGDFVKIDLKNPDGWFEKPITKTEDIKLAANEAYIYSDKIEEYDGVAKILKDDVLSFGARSFSSYVDQGHVFETDITGLNTEKGVYKLKADTIIIDAKDDHEVINIRNADIYLKNVKVASVPALKIVTNKQHIGAETNFPEFGSQSLLGMHIGPAVVLNVPGGSTLKLAPILTYYKSKLGVGGIARFRNPYNMTEVAYGTSADEVLVRGRQKLAPGLMLNYSRLTNQSDWFLGYRKPKYSAQLSYSRSDYVEDLRLNFSQKFMAGAFVDNKKGAEIRDTDWRFRWMTQTYKPVYTYQNDEGNIAINAGLVAQTVASAYTTGDVHGLFRIGPAVSTKVGPWKQSLLYYQTAIAGQSPFEFDRYRYGRSNFVFIESLKLCRYLTVGYLASLAMNRDVPSDDLFQENRVLVSIGPDYAKFTIGYDSIRHNTMFLLSMLVGTQDSDIQFKKTVVKNPNMLGKENNNSNKKFKKHSKRYYLDKLGKHKNEENNKN